MDLVVDKGRSPLGGVVRVCVDDRERAVGEREDSLPVCLYEVGLVDAALLVVRSGEVLTLDQACTCLLYTSPSPRDS